MKPPPPRLRIAIGALVALGVLVLLVFNLNWLRPAVVRYLHHTSQREVQIDDLQLRLDTQGRPIVRLRGVRIANAPWAGPAPLIVAREASFTFAWASLFDPVRVITEMHLVDAEVDLERQADGLRNWRLTHPDDRGPARIRVMRLIAERTRLHVVRHGVQLVLQAQSTPLAQDTAKTGFTQRVDFTGTLRGTPFEGHALSGPQLSLYDTGEPFALRGQAQSGDTQLSLDGHITDLLQLAGLDAQVTLQGKSLAALKPFMPRPPWPASKPYRFAGALTRQGTTWTAREASLALGRSDLAGNATYTRQAQRNVLEATVTSRELHLDDLPRQTEDAPVDTEAPPASRSTTRVLPQSAIPLDGLRALDGHVALQVATLRRPNWPVAHDVHADATLDRGRLSLKLLQGQLAGGTVQGRFALDARAASPDVQLDLHAQGLNLHSLWPALPEGAGTDWPSLQGQVTLSGHGPSLAAWLGSANGQVDLGVVGGSLSRTLDARLGLNTLRMLGALFTGDKPVPIRCGAVSMVFAKGIGRSRQLVLDTARTHVEGQANVHLGDETWALLLTPRPQGAAPPALPASIVAQGNFRGFRYALSERRQPDTAASAPCTRP